MSYDILKKIVGQKEVVVVDVYIQQNDPAFETWLQPGNYNTIKTSEPGTDFNPDYPAKIYRFSDQQLGPAAGIHFPILTGYSTTSPEIKDNIGLRAGLSVNLTDINTNDLFELPQEFADRRVEGSFLAKFIERNYLHNRTVVIHRGFDPINFDLNNFQSETYIIDKVSGPNYNGSLTLSCLDPLIWVQKSKAKAPRKNNGVLSAAFAIGQTTITITETENVGEYQDGFIAIDSEVLSFTITDDTPPNVTATVAGGQWGTVEATHDQGATAQQCFYGINENATDLILRLFRDFSSLTDDLILLVLFGCPLFSFQFEPL